MSRLFDRVLAHGARPLLFSDLLDGYVGVSSREHRDPDASARHYLEEQGIVPSASGLSAAHADVRRNSRSFLRSSTAYRASEMSGSPVIVADDAGRYFDSFDEGTSMGDLLGTVAPPFPSMFIEFGGVPNRLNLRSWGCRLATVVGPGIEHRPRTADIPEEARWVVNASVMGEWEKNNPVYIALATFFVDEVGTLMRGPLPNTRQLGITLGADDRLQERLEPEHYMFYSSRVSELLYAALLGVSFMHCKNVTLDEFEPTGKLSRAFERRHGRPLTRHWTLDIEPMKTVLARDGDIERRGLRHAVHICRGHFKSFTSEAPLFGKLTGTYWWMDHVRGDSDLGMIDKDYRIRIADAGLGRPYEVADEHPELAHAEGPGLDPDLAGRGLAAHARTQNSLARIVEGAGFVPRSPKPEEPQFDLAWETPTAIWIAEVKSLTPTNEMRQMHSALGQVIDYAHRLDDERPIRMMIAVERRPVSEHWVAECAEQGIVLVWPEGFAAGVNS